MFSVGASPFNSPSRQIYGGWTLDAANQANNLWAKKEYYRMTSKYAPDPDVRKDANKWLKMYRAAIKIRPELKKATRRQGIRYWDKALYPPLTQGQKNMIYRQFLDLPLSDDVNAQILSRLYRKAPYPNYTIMNRLPMLGVPGVAGRGDIDLVSHSWRTRQELQDAFKRMAQARRGSRSFTPAELINQFGLTPAEVNAYMAGQNVVKPGLLQ